MFNNAYIKKSKFTVAVSQFFSFSCFIISPFDCMSCPFIVTWSSHWWQTVILEQLFPILVTGFDFLTGLVGKNPSKAGCPFAGSVPGVQGGELYNSQYIDPLLCKGYLSYSNFILLSKLLFLYIYFFHVTLFIQVVCFIQCYMLCFFFFGFCCSFFFFTRWFL
jgi:hypothetical protein